MQAKKLFTHHSCRVKKYAVCYDRKFNILMKQLSHNIASCCCMMHMRMCLTYAGG